MKAWNGVSPDLVVLDPLASLAGLRRGDIDRWDALPRFLLHQRRHRRAVLMVHHANREGLLRGGTRREDLLDLVIALRRPERSLAGRARFEIHVEKARWHSAVPLVPSLASLHTGESGLAHWHWGPADAGRFERAVALLNQGLTASEAADALGVSRATLFRLKAEARANGLLNERSRS